MRPVLVQHTEDTGCLSLSTQYPRYVALEHALCFDCITLPLIRILVDTGDNLFAELLTLPRDRGLDSTY